MRRGTLIIIGLFLIFPFFANGAEACADPGQIGGTGQNAAVLLNSKVRTYIPHELNLGFKDIDGNDLVIRTAIHDIRFAVGQLRTDQPGGVSEIIPAPLFKVVNGVEYYEDNLLLSGVGFHGETTAFTFNPYCTYVFGPHDAEGHDWSDTPSSPRYNLAYLPVTLMVPKQHWNGRLVAYYHGGADYDNLYRAPVFPFNFPFDEIRLLKQGYAILTLATHATAQQQNPNATDGSFWQAFANPTLVKRFAHNGRVDSAGTESRYATENDTDVLITADASLARQVANLVKNLLKLRYGRRPQYSYAMGYSYGGKLIATMNSARDKATIFPLDHPEMLVDGRTPFNGGNFDISDWTNVKKGKNGPSLINTAGLVYDGFFGESALTETSSLWSPEKDPDYPITAKVVYVAGDVEYSDIITSSLLDLQYTAYALPDAHHSLHRDLNDWTRIYHLKYFTHARKDFLFASGLNTTGTVFYDRSVLFNPDGSYQWFSGGEAGLNEQGRGEPFRLFAESLYRFNRQNLIASYVRLFNFPDGGALGCAEYIASEPDTYSVRAQLFNNLVQWVETGVRPPKSRLSPYLMTNPDFLPGQQDSAGVWTGLPACGSMDPGAATEDCYFTMFDFPYPIPPDGHTALQYIKDHQVIDYIPEFVVPLEVAVPIGNTVMIVADFSWLKPFTTDKLKSLYGNHLGYVRAFTKAYGKLLSDRLIDPELGWKLVLNAYCSPILK